MKRATSTKNICVGISWNDGSVVSESCYGAQMKE